jgi:glycosyltransferase involved in cell wall biosynthesis
LGSDNRPAALILAPEAPYPLAGGGALRTASLLEYLARTHAVDLIVFQQPGAPDPRTLIPPGLTRQISVIPLPAHRRTLAAKAVRNAVRVARAVPPLVDRFAGFEDRIREAVDGRRYQIGLIEHFWCAPYYDQLAAACDQTVLDLHNIESLLHARCGLVESSAAAFAHRVFHKASLELERSLLPRFTQVLATSESDAAAARAIAPDAHVSVYCNAIPWTPVPPRAEEDVIVFSGNMEYHPNISAVRFFRGEIWPGLRERWPELVWRLVGRNAWAVRRYTSGDSRIEVQGEVDDAVKELARAKVAVAPLLTGSGTRLKIIEAWAAGVPVVSTSLGAEGLPGRDGEHLLLADGAVAFADAVSRLLACSESRLRLGSAGRLLMEKEFTWVAAWKNLMF